jgi:hypothetical protein
MEYGRVRTNFGTRGEMAYKVQTAAGRHTSFLRSDFKVQLLPAGGFRGLDHCRNFSFRLPLLVLVIVPVVGPCGIAFRFFFYDSRRCATVFDLGLACLNHFVNKYLI